jgi:hypothetical protein
MVLAGIGVAVEWLLSVIWKPLTSPKPAQAIPAPQVINFNVYGVSAAEGAEVVAEQSKALTERNTP